MEFFRKYQRPILFTAGIFALLTFSITPAIMSTASGWFERDRPMPTLTLGGRVVNVTPEDHAAAQQVRIWEGRGDLTVALPPIVESDGQEDRVEIYAALRRVAIEYGIEPSMDEVERAVQLGVQLTSQFDPGVTSPLELARRLGYPDVAAYYNTIAEAMRIGTLVRLEALGVDTTDAALVQSLIRDLELVTLNVAVIDAERIENELKEAGDPSDDELVSWLDKMTPMERRGFAGPDRFRADLAYVLLDGFDRAAFEPELEGLTISDAEVDRFYDVNKYELYRKPKPASGDGQGGQGAGGENQGAGGENQGAGEGPGGGNGQGGEQGSGNQTPEAPGGATPGGSTPGGSTTGGNGGDGRQGEPQDPGAGGAPQGEAGTGGGAGEPQSGGEQPSGGGETETPAPGEGTQQPQPTQEPTQEPTDADAAEQDPGFLELDEALRARIRSRLEAEAVVKALWQKVGERLDAHCITALAAFPGAEQPATTVEERLDALEDRIEDARLAVADLKVSANAEGATDADKEALTAAEALVETREAELTAAKDAVVAARASFDLAAVWTELAAGRPGFGVATTGTEPKPATDITEVDPVGKWTRAGVLNALAADRPLSTLTQHTANAVFEVRLTERVEAPLRPFAEIRDDALAQWFKERADERLTEARDAFEKALEEAARAKGAERIAELEKDRDTKVQERFESWQTELQGRIDELRTRVAELEATRGAEARSTRATRQKLTDAEAELAAADTKRESLTNELKTETDAEIEKVLSEQYREVLAGVCESVENVTLETVGPLPRDLAEPDRGARRQNYDKATQHLFFTKRLEGLEKVGDATELLDDIMLRSSFLAVVEAVAPATSNDITRRQLVLARRNAGDRRVRAVLVSYTRDALRERYGWRTPDEQGKIQPGKGDS
ncbi:MAG: hypothetical protein IPM29_18190 [Planctomycetes bacterium]|nr:hypothetical protein [Planctomycetota bacterium]